MITFNYQQKYRFILGLCLITSSAYSQTNNVVMAGVNNPPANIVIAKNPNSINNQLSAPSVFIFPLHIQTIGQAITEILKITEYSLSKNIPLEIQNILNKPLPMAYRRLEAMSVYAAIRTLTGAQIFMITPETKVLSFSFDQNLSAMDLKPKIITSALQNFLNRTHFTLRISEPLTDQGLIPATGAIVDWQNKSGNKTLYFGFNDAEQIIGIAGTQKEADSLSAKEISVFYARAGESVRQTISKWLISFDIKLFWQLNDDLVVEQESVFFGALKAHDGPLMQLLHSANQAGLHARAVFSANDALIIKPKVYSSMFLGEQK